MDSLLYQLGINPASTAGAVLTIVAGIWAIAALLTPITLLGIYQLAARQNRQLRAINETLESIEARLSRPDPTAQADPVIPPITASKD